MAASEFHSPDRSEPPPSTAQADSASPQAGSASPQAGGADRAPEQGLLEAILRETVPEMDVATPLGSAEREGLRDVARRHAGRDLVLDPVAVELVQAVLRPSVPDAWTGGEPWRRLTCAVATAVFDDPQFRRRLEALWSGLRAGLL